jgi:hypothetical protein
MNGYMHFVFENMQSLSTLEHVANALTTSLKRAVLSLLARLSKSLHN